MGQKRVKFENFQNWSGSGGLPKREGLKMMNRQDYKRSKRTRTNHAKRGGNQERGESRTLALARKKRKRAVCGKVTTGLVQGGEQATPQKGRKDYEKKEGRAQAERVNN